MKKIFLSLLFLIGLSSNSFGATTESFCSVHLKFGIPSQPNSINIKVCREGYALMFNTHTKTPIWVAEYLKKENVFGSSVRQATFLPDPEIPTQYQAKTKDYSSPDYDQGHMAPAADFSQNQKLMNESFYFSNVVPQNANNNRQIWAALEKKVRSWLDKRNELYVITGPVFNNNRISQTIGKSEVAVPDYLFKIVFDPSTQGSIAFLMPNQPLDIKDLPKYIVSVREIEKLTTLNFHSALPQNIQDKIETQKSGMWTR